MGIIHLTTTEKYIKALPILYIMVEIKDLGNTQKGFKATDKYGNVDESILKQLYTTITNSNEIDNCIDLIVLMQRESKSVFKSKDKDLINSHSNQYNKIGNRYTIINLQTLNYFANNKNGLVYLTTQENLEHRTYLTLTTEYNKTIKTKNGYLMDLNFEINHIDGNPRNNNYNNLQTVTQECHQDIHRAEEYEKIKARRGY